MPWSALTNSHHPPPPDLDAPTNLLARDESESAFSVVWDRSQAPVDGYVLTYSSSSSSSAPGGEIPVGPDTTTYRLTGLGPGAGYTVSVWAVKGDRVSRKTSTQAETGFFPLDVDGRCV